MEEFSYELKKLRGNKSYRQVEELTGLSHTYWSSLEKGFDPRSKKERKPTPDVIRKIANTFNVSYVNLMVKVEFKNYVDYL